MKHEQAKIISLINGTKICALITDENTSNITITNALTMLRHSESGKTLLTPFVPDSLRSITTIRRNAILAISSMNKDLYEVFIESLLAISFSLPNEDDQLSFNDLDKLFQTEINYS